MSVTRAPKRKAKSRATTVRPHARAASVGSKQDRLALHRAKCSICKHPDREEIERDFLDWVSPRELAEHWKTGSYRAIYRHAHTVGLYEQRRKNWQAALDRIIERVGEVQVTAAAVISAIRLSAKLDREEKQAPSPEGRQAGFKLSMDGLPRTDAVTGHAEAAATGRGDPLGRPPAEKESRKPLPSAPPRERKTDDGDSPSARRNDPTPSGKQAARTAAPASPETPPTPVAPDPRIALSEDGRVAGIPWPKGKVTFARRGRWRPGRPGR
jgi:hypothetical protein